MTNGYALSFEPLRSKRGFHIKRFEQPVDVSLSPSPPYFPVLIHYTREKFFSLEDDGVTIRSNSFSDPKVFGPSYFFKDGYLSAEFKSDAFTNVNGLSFPTIFEYREYKPKHEAKTTNDLNCVFIVHGTANNITVGKQELDMRLPAMNSFIQDLRVPEPAVLYKITNRVVPNPDSPEAVTIRERAVSRMARQVEIENEKAHLAMVARKRKIIWAGLSITILAIASVVFFVRKSTTDAKRRTRNKLT